MKTSFIQRNCFCNFEKKIKFFASFSFSFFLNPKMFARFCISRFDCAFPVWTIFAKICCHHQRLFFLFFCNFIASRKKKLSTWTEMFWNKNKKWNKKIRKIRYSSFSFFPMQKRQTFFIFFHLFSTFFLCFANAH